MKPKKTRSRHVRNVPMVDRATDAGRTTSINTARNHKLPGSEYAGSLMGSRAARMTKSAEMSSTRRFSLNSTMCRTVTTFWLAKALPITVTASSPDSDRTRSDNEKTTITTANVTGLCRKSGTQ